MYSRLHVQNTIAGWDLYIGKKKIGGYAEDSKTFTKKEHKKDRYHSLKDGDGHGFPFECYIRLKQSGCQLIKINEDGTLWKIPFNEFEHHMEFKNSLGEIKTFCSLKWFKSDSGEKVPSRRQPPRKKNLFTRCPQLTLFDLN